MVERRRRVVRIGALAVILCVLGFGGWRWRLAHEEAQIASHIEHLGGPDTNPHEEALARYGPNILRRIEPLLTGRSEATTRAALHVVESTGAAGIPLILKHFKGWRGYNYAIDRFLEQGSGEWYYKVLEDTRNSDWERRFSAAIYLGSVPKVYRRSAEEGSANARKLMRDGADESVRLLADHRWQVVQQAMARCTSFGSYLVAPMRGSMSKADALTRTRFARMLQNVDCLESRSLLKELSLDPFREVSGAAKSSLDRLATSRVRREAAKDRASY